MKSIFRQSRNGGLDVSHIHRLQSNAAWADDRSRLNFVVVLDVGWHE